MVQVVSPLSFVGSARELLLLHPFFHPQSAPLVPSVFSLSVGWEKRYQRIPSFSSTVGRLIEGLHCLVVPVPLQRNAPAQ